MNNILLSIFLLHASAHFGAGVAVGAVTNAACHISGLKKSRPVLSESAVFGSAVLAGAAKEWIDWKQGGQFDWAEFGFTALGGALAVQLKF